jgi:CDP-4-dehydro-6-deoxyglucose reductase, E3
MATITTTPGGSVFSANSEQTILQAALESGVGLPYGCGNGFCGSCKAKLTAGKAAYPEGYEPNALSAEEQAEHMILCCKAHAETDVTIEVEEIKTADAIKPELYQATVASMHRFMPMVMQVNLDLGDARMPFLPGQYIEFVLSDGKRRAFSIANMPHDSGLIELHIGMVQGGGFTSHVFDIMSVGKRYKIEGPLGSFFLREDSPRDIVMVAGGTGFAPIKGMIEHALAEKLSRRIHLFWGASSLEGLYMTERVQEWTQQNDNLVYYPVTDKPVIDKLVEVLPDLSRYDVYMAGPPAMIQAGKVACHNAGLPDDQLFYDSFELADDAQ